MKTLLLSITLISSFVLFSQTRTTITNGDFLNPFIWDCTCIPQSGEQAVINHNVVMNTGIYYTAGQITINSGASLVQDGTDRAFWADGTGSFVNNGTFTAHHLLISPNADLDNNGTIVGVDSVWIQGDFNNVGSAQMFDFLNDETGSTTNTGSINVLNNMNNQGSLYNSADIEIANDFSNCNLQTLDAMLDNVGVFCVTNEFLNCAGDTLDGSGHYFVGGSSANFGSFEGTFTFHTPSGTVGVPGSIKPGVTVTTGSCSVSLFEQEQEVFSIYPNPSNGVWEMTISDKEYILYDIHGIQVDSGWIKNNRIDGSELSSGIYLLDIPDVNYSTRLIKE